MGVVKNSKRKLRFILDCRYETMFLMYEHFCYERLSEVPQYLQLDDSFVQADVKSGYQVGLTTDTWWR